MQDYAITNQFIISDHGVVNDIDPKDKIFTKLNKQEGTSFLWPKL